MTGAQKYVASKPQPVAYHRLKLHIVRLEELRVFCLQALPDCRERICQSS